MKIEQGVKLIADLKVLPPYIAKALCLRVRTDIGSEMFPGVKDARYQIRRRQADIFQSSIIKFCEWHLFECVYAL